MLQGRVPVQISRVSSTLTVLRITCVFHHNQMCLCVTLVRNKNIFNAGVDYLCVLCTTLSKPNVTQPASTKTMLPWKASGAFSASLWAHLACSAMSMASDLQSEELTTLSLSPSLLLRSHTRKYKLGQRQPPGSEDRPLQTQHRWKEQTAMDCSTYGPGRVED